MTTPTLGQAQSATTRQQEPDMPTPDRWHALGCPVAGCDWHSPPYPATTGRHDVATVRAYVEHVYDAHPQYRGLIDNARAAARTGGPR